MYYSVNTPDYMLSKYNFIMLDGSIVGCGQSWGENYNRAISEVECLGSDTVRKTSGLLNWDVSFDALQALTDDASTGRKNFDDIMRHHINVGTAVQVYLAPQESADVSTAQIYWYGDAIIEGVTRNVPVGSDPVSYSVTMQGSGDLTETDIATGIV